MSRENKIVVTGASGYIGSLLCGRLVSDGRNVVGIGRRAQTGGEFPYISADIAEPAQIEKALSGAETVIHLAARAHVLAETAESPLAAFRAANRDAAIKTCNAAIASGARRFVFVSSIGVNGQTSGGVPFDENARADPESDYALAKYEAEVALRALCQDRGLELVIVRPPLVYSARAPGNFARLLKLMASGLPLPFRNIDNRRNLLAIENLVDFLILCVDHPSAADELFLIADVTEVSTTAIARHIAIGMGKSPYFWSVPNSLARFGAQLTRQTRLYEQLFGSLVIDTSKARDLLGWTPLIDTLTALENAGRRYKADHAP